MIKTMKILCTSCEGTGLYKGMGEKDNCAVVCSRCDGEGFINYQYQNFTKLVKRENIDRVFKGCGYCQSSKNTNDIKFSEGGCTYEEWLNGVQPKPIKDLYCPFYWTGQDRNTSIYKIMCVSSLPLCGYISQCPRWVKKSECWKIYDKEIQMKECFKIGE